MSGPDGADFDAVRILEVLSRHEVRCILIGGYAAQLYGASRPTTDVDITPDRARSNIRRPHPECQRDRGRPVLIRIAALEDIIRSKEAAGRPKDLNALPELYALNKSARDAAG